MEFGENEFTGQTLLSLVLSVEAAIGSHAAGCTPLGMAIIALCEDAAKKDRIPASELGTSKYAERFRTGAEHDIIQNARKLCEIYAEFAEDKMVNDIISPYFEALMTSVEHLKSTET